jgi:large repetitive protein
VRRATHRFHRASDEIQYGKQNEARVLRAPRCKNNENGPEARVKTKSLLALAVIAFPFFLISCGTTTAPTTYSIGGTVSGLSGTGLVLQDNGADNLTVVQNGSFTFPTAVATGKNYAVTVLTQPSNPAQTCTVTYGGTGTAAANVVIVQVTCATNTFTVGGNVSGLTGSGLVLQNNGGNNLSVTANGSFAFSSTINRGSNYNVTILTQPSNPTQNCAVTNGFGATTTGNVTAIRVTCFTTSVTYTIGGIVSGLSGTGLVLQDNSGDNLPITKNGSFTFPTVLPSGSSFSVTVFAQPASPTQTCTVTGGGGTATANITGILVNCTTTTFTLGGTITGLTGSGLILQNNGANSLPVAANSSSFTFTNQVASGSTYAVTALAQPTPSCAITNGSGKVGSASVSNIAIACGGNSSNIGVTVSGLLANTAVVLQDNGGDNLTVSASGIATNFNTPVASGAAYAVTVLTQPAGQTCTLGTNASGKTAGANINVAVTCATTITAGVAHTCAVSITSAGTGTVLCWGSNEFGQLGDGQTASTTSPVQVTGLDTSVISIAAGSESTCALTSMGTVLCWGDNSNGQLGNGTFTQSTIPVKVLDSTGTAPLADIVRIAAGGSHTCAVTNSGAALCWGDNSNGQLGNGTEIVSALPVTVSGLSGGVSTIAAGSDFTCAVTTTGGVECWGDGASGRLGNGTVAGSATPSGVVDPSGSSAFSGVVTISAGFENACAISAGGNVFCWGANGSGQLGDGAVSPASAIPVEVLQADGTTPLAGVVAISSGMDSNCAMTTAGATECWGANASGQLGNGGDANSLSPVVVSGLAGGSVAIASGEQHACVASSAGTAQCWGANASGQLANGTARSSAIPVEAEGVNHVGLLRLF